MIRIPKPSAHLSLIVALFTGTALFGADPPGHRDWPQWGGSPLRNNVSDAKNIPIHWNVGRWDRKTGNWNGATNVKWVADVETGTWPPYLYSGPAVSGGKVFIGSNSSAAHVSREPPKVDLATLLCFQVQDGKTLWQLSSPRRGGALAESIDWPLNAIASTPYVDGDRLWLVTNRCEVVCLDSDGFYDGANDGPFQQEAASGLDAADVVWTFDMMDRLGVSPHNAARCSITGVGEAIFVSTSNGVDATHSKVPSPDAPSFLAMDRNTGRVVWSDNTPGRNILHGQWSSPAYGVLGGVPQVIFGGGDGWLYSFDLYGDRGTSTLLWKFDCNPKQGRFSVGGRSTRNPIVATPVIDDGLVYVAVGDDPEHGEGNGHLWCIEPNLRGDVSAELVFKRDDLSKPLPPRRIQAVVPENGEIALPNPNSAAVWHFAADDADGIGKIRFEKGMHRTCNSPAIKGGLLFIADCSGLLHCIDAKTGKQHWAYDMLAPCYCSPLIAGNCVYIGDEDGDVAIFRVSADPHLAMDNGGPIAEMNMHSSIMGTPIVANGVLYITTKRFLFAISEGGT